MAMGKHTAGTYHEDDCATFDEVTLEAFVDNPLCSVYIEGSKNLTRHVS